MTLGAVFSDREVARLYRHRAPYPDEVLTTLRRLLVAPRTILDVGAGTGALARRMASFSERVDAVDPSAAMIAEGRALPGGDEPKLKWILGSAEDVPLSPPYGLITAGASLHWLNLDVALARFREALAPDAVMAVADTEIVHGSYWDELLAIIRAYSEIEHHTETPDLMEELGASGRFAIEGRQRTEALPFEQSVGDYIEMLHSTSSLARMRLGDRASGLDADVRALFARYGLDALRYGIVGGVIWGRPT
ncbi:MAG TPA: class I SAM-dependent methyltransferase [Candidatus Limnocylindrales bacterium]|jgi:SAM-dependent methyltransferase